MGAEEDAALAAMKSALGGIPVRHAMVKKFETLSSSGTLADAVQEILGKLLSIGGGAWDSSG